MTTTPVIDVHAHTMAPIDELVRGQEGAELQAAEDAATFGEASNLVNIELMIGSWYEQLTSTEARLTTMDRQGVDVQAVSISPTQYHYWADRPRSSEIVAAVNQAIRDQVAAASDRLIGLGSVALQHPDLAASQLDALMADPMFCGVEISSSAAGRELGDVYFDPFWLAAERTGALVYIHPWGCSLGPRLGEHYLGNIVGQPLETTVALSHIVFGGVLDRYPQVRICAAHGGGFLPHYLGRSNHAWKVRPDSHGCQHLPSSYLARMWFDSVVHDPGVLERLVSVVGSSHVVLGTDHPFDMGDDAPLDLLAATQLAESDRLAIAGGNLAQLISWGGR